MEEAVRLQILVLVPLDGEALIVLPISVQFNLVNKMEPASDSTFVTVQQDGATTAVKLVSVVKHLHQNHNYASFLL